ncbi:unnamed protein product [Paramecium pentaurelia]|uniref:Uncharacterized protein n=1 Tax=Paramecium pentaurelia TaxID=43138 RepID=A0A8S1XD04_9CILI|nr:unnamed protein product [Paramecium pentaurelia]
MLLITIHQKQIEYLEDKVGINSNDLDSPYQILLGIDFVASLQKFIESLDTNILRIMEYLIQSNCFMKRQQFLYEMVVDRQEL